MTNEIALRDQQTALTASDVKSHVGLIQEVMGAVMKPETHYGTIPGCNKPTLYKAGSEVLLATFRIAVEPEVEDLSHGDEIRYRVRCVGRHQLTGIVVGTGIGECSCLEEKYRWRRAVCDEEFEATPENRRRLKWQRGQSKAYAIKQVRTDPADVANTVLKMAKKRAQIDLTLTATAASDIFAQDLEDLPEGMAAETEPSVSAPQATGGNVATDKQVRLIQARADAASISAADICKRFGVESLPELPFAKVNEVLAFLQKEKDQP